MPVMPGAAAIGSRRRKTRYVAGSVTDVTTNVSGIIAFHDAATNVTLNGSTVTQIDDARGATGHLPLVGFGAPLPSYDSVAKTLRTDGTQNYLKIATDARFALNQPGCLVMIGTNENTGFPVIVSSDDVTQFMTFSRSATPKWESYLPGGVGAQSDLTPDASIHLFVLGQVPPPGGGSLTAQITYVSVGDDLRRWFEDSTPFSSLACSVAVGKVPGNTNFTATTYAASLYLDHVPRPSELAAIRRFALARGAAIVGSSRSYLSCVGDSITYGQGCTTPATDAWPNLMASQFAATYAVDKRGVSGRTAAEVLTCVDHLIVADNNGAVGTRWLIPWLGTNDIKAGTSGATTFASLNAICQKAMDAGMKVMVPTAMKRTDVTGAAETERQNLNASIMQMVTNGQATQVCDIASSVDPTNTPTVSSDGIHPNTTWNVTIKNNFVTALQATGKF